MKPDIVRAAAMLALVKRWALRDWIVFSAHYEERPAKERHEAHADKA